MEWRANAPKFRLLKPSLSPIQPEMKEWRKEWNPQCYGRQQQTEGSRRQKSLEQQSHRIWSEDKKKRANEAKHSEANVTWNKTDYYSEGGVGHHKVLSKLLQKITFIHAQPPAPPPSPSASLESTRQHHPPTTAVAEWMMSNRVGEWGHYRDAQLWIGTPEPSFVPHSRLPLTLKCAAHLTPGGETGVAAHFRYVFLKLKQAGLFWEGASTMLP